MTCIRTITTILADILADAGMASTGMLANTLEQLEACKGAYVLIIRLAGTAPVVLPKHAGALLAPGTYLYVGSANGPGGIRARLKRHFRRDKKSTGMWTT